MNNAHPAISGDLVNKTIHFISGLPRSGSTLLCNILAQNPRFDVTSTSGILDVLFSVRNQWNNLIEFKASPNEAAKVRVLRAMLDAYHADTDRPVVFNKSRGWLAYLEMAELILERPAKVLVPVRDLRDVLASFEKLWRRQAATAQIGQEAQNYFDWQTVEGRCQVWSRIDQPVGLAYNRIKDALQRGYGDRLHFVEFEQLTKNPKRALENVYEFLGEEPFEHDFGHVAQLTHEDDEIFGFRGLHHIRQKVEPMEPQWPKILGPTADTYQGQELW